VLEGRQVDLIILLNFRLLGDYIGMYIHQCFFLKISTNTCDTFFHGKSYVSMLTKNGLGYNLGDFFTNASGHPDAAFPERHPGEGHQQRLPCGQACRLLQHSGNEHVYLCTYLHNYDIIAFLYLKKVFLWPMPLFLS
jgi:hypothetical protein